MTATGDAGESSTGDTVEGVALPDAPIAPLRMAHFVLVSADKARLVDWYTTVFGCQTLHANDRIAFLTFDAEHHRIAIAEVTNLAPRPEHAAGVHHIAFTYADLDALLSTYARLKAAGILPHWCVNHGMSTSMYYRDPDGNQIELQIDNFNNEADLKAVFDTPAFAANVRGIDFDPDKLLALRQAGTPAGELTKPGTAAAP
jgi:catechol-2,3-dioxygenase